MTEQQRPSLKAEIEPARTVSKIWLVPILALLIGGWMIYYQWANQGPSIVIDFDTASGLEAGKTKIKIRDLEIGTVKKIELADDLKGVKVTARLSKDVESLLHADNQFWIVSPRVSLSGISGLGTILSGPYINMEVGIDEQLSYKFTALSSPPITKAGTPGLHITLNSESEFAYKKGDPVIYKGIQVGEFEDIYFNFDERTVYYNTFIRAPYHELITNNTQFWDISGVQMDLSASGFKVQTGSVETLLTNGVTFGVPEGMPRGEIVTQRSYFTIHPNYELAVEERYKLSAKYVIFVKDTVRGLKVGAPVEYRGLVIGKVLSINAIDTNQTGLLQEGYDIPVLIGIQPGRVQQTDNQQGVEFVRKQIDLWVEQGLRATLESGNLLTGALFIDLQHYPNEEPVQLTHNIDYPVIPTITGEFSQITAKISTVLDNINSIDMGGISSDASSMLQEIASTASSLQTTSGKLDAVLKEINQAQVGENLVNTLDNITRLTQSFSEDSNSYQQLTKTLTSLQHTMKSLQPILHQLNNKPNSLIFAGKNNPQFTPKAQQNDGETP